MNRTAIMTAIVALVVAAAILAGVLPGYFEKREQIEKTISAFEHLQAAVDAGAGVLEYKHRLVKATAAWNRLNQIDQEFKDREAGKSLHQALGYFRIGPECREKKEAKGKSILMEFSEVDLHSAEADSLDTFRYLKRNGMLKEPPLGDLLLEPFARGEDLAHAYLKRAAGLLSNAQISLGRKKGPRYTLPPASR